MNKKKAQDKDERPLPGIILQLPDRRELGVENEESWSVTVDDPVEFDYQTFVFTAPVDVTAVVSWVDTGILSVKIKVSTKISGKCVRCLCDTELAISDNLLYLYKSRGKSEEGDEMVVEVGAFGSTLDISEQVWECLILLLPSRLLCKEDCRGLCPSCGANLND